MLVQLAAYCFLWHVDLGLNHQVLQRGAQDLWHLVRWHLVQAAAREEVIGKPRLAAASAPSPLHHVRFGHPDCFQARHLEEEGLDRNAPAALPSTATAFHLFCRPWELLTTHRPSR